MTNQINFINLRDIAFNAMWYEYQATRSPQRTRIEPDWQRNIEEKYEGTVYEEAKQIEAFHSTHIDPHQWADIKQTFCSIIEGASGDALKLKSQTPESYFEEECSKLNQYMKDPALAFQVRIMLAGVVAAKEAYFSPPKISL